MPTEFTEIEQVFETYSAMIYRVCFVYLKNQSDAEDATADTFVRLMESKKAFESDEHLKAWLIVTAKNLCKDSLSHWWRKKRADSETLDFVQAPDEENDTLAILLELPVKYREALSLYYQMGYSGDETAKILGISPSALYARLSRGREMLRKMLGEEAPVPTAANPLLTEPQKTHSD
ncbi:MAG TPA: sigma-70 family RNA polymerase sigma factor [Oscillospiraceae bacterium]|nr:sigma-70 family RNA polymerase sigma factor [Oscillospiraceae bacterium]HPF56775.1 sigma-70 family RNA polymerase sigma factor [Clostridiales bacterium]HPK36279.1 sigma-70 family RNA polymerase sigma factor [Oscillospiraceae bacterium]HPR76913.1 sigma-70 family RNA polymerase sigma factor [Oscillospiraceae bacterium]